MRTGLLPSRRIPGSALLTEIEQQKAIIRAATLRLRYSYRPDGDVFVIYNVGTRFASLAAANPEQLREQRFAGKLTYSFTPSLERIRKSNRRQSDE